MGKRNSPITNKSGMGSNGTFKGQQVNVPKIKMHKISNNMNMLGAGSGSHLSIGGLGMDYSTNMSSNQLMFNFQNYSTKDNTRINQTITHNQSSVSSLSNFEFNTAKAQQ